MLFAFYAQTEYQLLNIIKFVLNDCEDSKGKSDLFLSDRIKDLDKKVDILSEQSIFDKIYIVKSIEYNSNKWVRKAKMLWYILHRSFLRNLILTETNLRKKYNVIVVGSASVECEILWNYFEYEDLYFIEDGLGSMMGSVEKDTYGTTRKILSNFLYKQTIVKKMYISNLDFCVTMPGVKNYMIPNFHEREFSTLIDLLYMPPNYNDSYKNNDIIYLQQPMSLFGKDFVVCENFLIKEIINLCDDNFIMRDHPRNVKKKFFDVRVDSNNYMWEFVAKKNITNTNMLIGLFSTAQFTPKMLFDYEPCVVFLFNLFPLPEERKELMNTITSRLKSAYSEPSKVVAPKSLDELKLFLEQYFINISLN